MVVEEEKIEFKRRVSEKQVEKNKKVKVSTEEEEDAKKDDKNHQKKLQAILMADTPDHKFRPITLEHPKVLMPLLNVPLIEYTLTWLRSHSVNQVFIVCCDCFYELSDYLYTTMWFEDPYLEVIMIRDVYYPDSSFIMGQLLNHIRGDFLIIRGDIVSDMCIKEALKVHKEIRQKERDAIMTMVINTPKRDICTYESLCGYDDLYTRIDFHTNQLLYYENDEKAHRLALDFGEINFRVDNSYQDCQIYICGYEVLEILYQNSLRPLYMDQFVKTVLNNKMWYYKIFTHELPDSSYADRVDKFRSYDTISKDLIRRFGNTSEADAQFCGCCSTEPETQGMYKKLVLEQSILCDHSSVVAYGVDIAPLSKISNSVIGRGCTIGPNVIIEGSYIWDNVTIESGCTLRNAIICDRVVMKSDSHLEPDTLLSFEVEVGPKFHGYVNLKVSLVPTPIMRSGRATQSAAKTRKLDLRSGSNIHENVHKLPDTSEVDESDVGYIWACEGYEEDWRNRISSLPDEKVILHY